ncbi:MAG: transglycosylase domain-containing protein [Eubacteriales bacterium]|nr:transglycosylase domain-containing protein [Eubacteriales bacterium]
MSKKKKMWICLGAAAAAMLICVCAAVAPVVSRGWHMYETAIEEKGVDSLIASVRGQENYVALKDISPEFLEQLLASEDHRFYAHPGIDLLAIGRALVHNVLAGRMEQGGSTITQQLAKNLYFSFEKTGTRKVAELFAAFRLESVLSKDEILELYCNVIYFGEGCYGLPEAAEHYFGVPADTLTTQQAAALVHTIKAPSRYNPNALRLAMAN